MLFRYKKKENGSMVKTATVYTAKEHGIDSQLLDQDAVRIVQRLQRSGYTAYLVGGAVRDLLLGKRPKDFDLVTSAEPNHIRKIFRNSRIIGKRFRLVHVFFRDDKIIEVSTFRSNESGTFNNVFGTIEEDAFRRDFSLNALYYDPVEEQIIDFVGGFTDIKKKKIKPLIPENMIFVEDPVRMIRAVKYARTTSCRLGFFFKRHIRKSSHLLAEVSASRLTEEAFKILQGAYSADLIADLASFGLLEHIMPRLAELLKNPENKQFSERFMASMRLLDKAVLDHHEGRRSIQLSYLLADYFYTQSPFVKTKKIDFVQAYHDLKDFLKPVTPPNVEVERCLVYLLRKRALYASQGGLGLVDRAVLTDDHGEYTKDLETLHDARDGRRRRRPLNTQVPKTNAKLNSEQTSLQPSPSGQADAPARKKRRPHKKKTAPDSAPS